jgi:D-3-phosphoglycerate dehydrogenase / 2-oxoglutarate reductase
MKVLIFDKITDPGIQYLRQQKDFNIIEAYDCTQQQRYDHIKDAEAIIVRSETQVTAEIIAAASRLKVIGRAGVGVDNIDVNAATEKGIIVMNAPGGNTIATAELTITHMLCATRPITQANAIMKQGAWERKNFAGNELFQKNLGIIGLGRIGREVAKRAQAFGMQVAAYDPYLTEEQAQTLEIKKVTLQELFKQSDYITIHVPKTEKTTNLINAQAFSQMKDGVRIINCARGGIINEDDLTHALQNKKVGAAGLDVYKDEPLSPTHPLRSMQNVVLTPHLGASTKEAQLGVGLEVAQSITEALKGGIIRNAVNMPSVDPRSMKILKPYLTLGEKLGTILQQISPKEIEKIKISYWGKILDIDSLPLTRSIQRGYLKKICGKNINDINAPYQLKNLGIESEVIQSNNESDYNELIQVQTITPDQKVNSIEGTLISKNNRPRIVRINEHVVEADAEGQFLILENEDVPGIVGMLGTVLGKNQVNIANMSLSRNAIGSIALTVLQLDSCPDNKTLKELTAHQNIKTVYAVEL